MASHQASVSPVRVLTASSRRRDATHAGSWKLNSAGTSPGVNPSGMASVGSISRRTLQRLQNESPIIQSGESRPKPADRRVRLLPQCTERIGGRIHASLAQECRHEVGQEFERNFPPDRPPEPAARGAEVRGTTFDRTGVFHSETCAPGATESGKLNSAPESAGLLLKPQERQRTASGRTCGWVWTDALGCERSPAPRSILTSTPEEERQRCTDESALQSCLRSWESC